MIPIPRLGNAPQPISKESEGAIQKRKEEFLMGSLGYGGGKKLMPHISGSAAMTAGSTIASTQNPLQEATMNNQNACSSTVYNAPDLKQKLARSKQYFKINSYLYSKYSSSQNYYYIKEINEILSDARCTELIRFRQLSDFSQPKEYLQELVPRDQSSQLIRSLTDYYRYHKEIPRMFAKSIYDLYFEHHDLKRRVEYVIITKQLKAEKTNDDCKVAEDKLRKLRQRDYDPMLVGLPEYSFIQKYYHHRESKPIFGEQQSRTCYSIFDKLNKVVNNSNVSKLSNQSFMQGGQQVAGISPTRQGFGNPNSSTEAYPGFGPHKQQQQVMGLVTAPKSSLLSSVFARPATGDPNVATGAPPFNFSKNKNKQSDSGTNPAGGVGNDLERIFAVGRKQLAAGPALPLPAAKRTLVLDIEGVGETAAGPGGNTARARTLTLQERIREFSRSEESPSPDEHGQDNAEETEGTRQSDGLTKKRKIGLVNQIPNPVHKKKITTAASKSRKSGTHTKKQSSDIFSSTHEDQTEKIYSNRGRKSQEKYIFTGLRGLFEDDKNKKPRSLSKKKKQSPSLRQTGGIEKTKTIGHPESRPINFNFNWTKVNKVLTNPLLINKSLVPTGSSKLGGRTHRDKVAESSVGSGGGNGVATNPLSGSNKHSGAHQNPKNYLDTKSKLVKGYHHKMNSMVVSHDSGPFSKVPTKEELIKPKRELDVFSRKNSYGEMDMRALLGIKTSQGFSVAQKDKETSTVAHSTRQRVISHSKKNSIYDLMLPESLVSGGSTVQQQKKAMSMRKRKKKVASLHTFEPSIVPRPKQEYSTSVLLPAPQAQTEVFSRGGTANGHEAPSKPSGAAQAHPPAAGPGPSQHKYTKSEPERLFVTKSGGVPKKPAAEPQAAWDQQVTKRFHLK